MSTITISQASRNLSHYINKASYGDEAVVLTSRGRPKAILLGVEAFQMLLGFALDNDEGDLLSAEQLAQQFNEQLRDAGYESREALLALAKDVRHEVTAEQFGEA